MSGTDLADGHADGAGEEDDAPAELLDEEGRDEAEGQLDDADDDGLGGGREGAAGRLEDLGEVHENGVDACGETGYGSRLGFARRVRTAPLLEEDEAEPDELGPAVGPGAEYVGDRAGFRRLRDGGLEMGDVGFFFLVLLSFTTI